MQMRCIRSQQTGKVIIAVFAFVKSSLDARRKNVCLQRDLDDFLGTEKN